MERYRFGWSLSCVHPLQTVQSDHKSEDDDMKGFWSTRELGDEAGVSTETAARWASDGLLPGAYKMLGRWRIPSGSAEALLSGEAEWDAEDAVEDIEDEDATEHDDDE